MTSGWLLLGLASLICVGVYANGVRFSRGADRFAARFGKPAATVQRIGRLFMIAAPVFWLIFAALCFGLFGPVQNIQTIQF